MAYDLSTLLAGSTKDGAGNIYLVQGNSSLMRIAVDGKVDTVTKGLDS